MRKFAIFQVFFVLLLLACHISLSYAAKGSFSELYNQGIEFYKQGKYDQAGETFEKALELKPSDVYALYGLGNTHYCKGKYDEATIVYNKAIKINPEYAKVHYSLSLAYNKLGRTKDAEEEKKIFRALSKGGKGAKKSLTQAKKPQARKYQTKAKKYQTKEESTQTEEKPQTFKVKRTGEESHKVQAEKDAWPSTKTNRRVRNIPIAKEKEDYSQTIFKGYSKETKKIKQPKPKQRKYTKKRAIRKYVTTFGLWAFIKDKWAESSLNKIWICTAGYIFTTQMWLCAMTFIGVIVWRIRNRLE